MQNKWKNKNFKEALKNSFNGIKYIFKTQRNFKIQLIIALCAIISGIVLKINLTEFAILFLVIFMVLFAEFTNTIIETIVDMYTEEYNEKAKIAKDVAAGSVTLVSISSIIIGLCIFLPKICKLIIK